jgi:hypothetical protein
MWSAKRVKSINRPRVVLQKMRLTPRMDIRGPVREDSRESESSLFGRCPPAFTSKSDRPRFPPRSTFNCRKLYSRYLHYERQVPSFYFSSISPSTFPNPTITDASDPDSIGLITAPSSLNAMMSFLSAFNFHTGVAASVFAFASAIRSSADGVISGMRSSVNGEGCGGAIELGAEIGEAKEDD